MSVIIPTCDRTESLARCLEQLRGGAEVIVSDDGQTTATRELISARFPNVKWYQGPRRGPAANRNHGVRHAVGEWLAFVDEDCIPDETWLEEIARAISASDVIERENRVFGQDKSSAGGDCGKSQWGFILELQSGDPPRSLRTVGRV
jgi:glycosyltransferase involved in cell wall biosynthesis